MMIKHKIQYKESRIELGKVIRYAWANENEKTWYITNHQKSSSKLKGCRLLIILTCEETTNNIHTNTTYPSIGDVISDTDGNILKIVDCKWHI